MRSKSCHGGASKTAFKDNKFKDMLWVVNEVILPMTPPKDKTIFAMNEREVFVDLLCKIQINCPCLFGKYKMLLILQEMTQVNA